MIRLISAGVVLVVLNACGPERPEPVTQAPAPVEVEQTGSAVHEGRVGTAALLRVNGDRGVGPVELRLAFVDAAGKPIATTDESLPYCSARASCWWAATFFADDFGGERVRGVRITVLRADRYDGETDVTGFTVRRSDDGTIVGTPPGEEGHAYVVAFQDSKPRWGASVSVTGESGRSIALPPDLLPSVDGEELRGFFYPGAVPAGD